MANNSYATYEKYLISVGGAPVISSAGHLRMLFTHNSPDLASSPDFEAQYVI